MLIPLEQFMRIGFPKFSESSSASSYTIEYIGPIDDLTKPANGETWGDFPGTVSNITKEELGLSGYALMSVTVEEKFGEAPTAGTITEVAYELEWVSVSRPLAEHPKFSAGGASALAQQDLINLEYWKDRKTKDFKFYERDASGQQTGSIATLSTNAQKYAGYVLLGVETFTDFAPVARKNSTYSGGPPNAADAGEKGTLPGGFPNAPAGTWEYVKSADRSNRAAGQRKWQRTEEWTGAFKVLVDNRDLYL